MKEVKLWCEANKKKLSLEAFKSSTGFDFFDFFKKNKKACLLGWNIQFGVNNVSTKKNKMIKAKKIPQYIFWKEIALKERLRKIKELKSQIKTA